MSQYILYDLPSKQNNDCWSPNTWKARAALNFKNVPYETRFIPYTELEQTLKNNLGIAAHPPGSFATYTLPVVRFPDGSYVMDSAAIVEKLESTQPSPTLRLDDALQQEAQQAIDRIIGPMVAFVFLRVHDRLVTEDEKSWIRNDRESRACKMTGRDKISLEEWAGEDGGTHLLEAAEPGFKRLTQLLMAHKQDQGPYICGSKPCYADLMVSGLVDFYKRLGEDAYDKLATSVEGLEQLYRACNPWFERKNY